MTRVQILNRLATGGYISITTDGGVPDPDTSLVHGFKPGQDISFSLVEKLLEDSMLELFQVQETTKLWTGYYRLSPLGWANV